MIFWQWQRRSYKMSLRINIVIFVTLIKMNECFGQEQCEACQNHQGDECLDFAANSTSLQLSFSSNIDQYIAKTSECVIELTHLSNVLNVTVNDHLSVRNGSGSCNETRLAHFIYSCHIDAGTQVHLPMLEFFFHHNFSGVVSLRFKNNVTFHYGFPPKEEALTPQVLGKSLLSIKSTSSLEFCRQWNENYTKTENFTKLLCLEQNSKETSECSPNQANLTYADSYWRLQVLDSSLQSVSARCLFFDNYSSPPVKIVEWNRTEAAQMSSSIILVVGLAVVAFLLVVSVVIIGVLKSRSKRTRLDSISTLRTNANVEEINIEELVRNEEVSLIEGCAHYALENFQLGRVLGCGEFGEVRRATLMDGSARWDVALKASKKTELSDELTREARIMRQASYNENIVNLQGITSASGLDDEGDIYLVLEYCSNGSLADYLKMHREKFLHSLKSVANSLLGSDVHEDCKTNFNLLVEWGHQISKGMEYLVSKSIIHGDLAARNVLLTSDLMAKLSDFGLAVEIPAERLSDDLPNGAMLTKNKCPVRWMAPESLLNGYVTPCSEVWAFGVVLWEIFSLASFPYDGVTITTPLDMRTHLEAGHRLKPSPFCPQPIYEIMANCWLWQPLERPHFSTLSSSLAGLLCTDYRRKFEDIVKKLSDQHNAIQNKLYHMMT